MINSLLQSIRDNSDWLYSIIFQYKWFYYDLWSFVHLWSGAIILSILTAFKAKRRWFKLLLILVFIGIANAVITAGTFSYFWLERSLGIFNDILTGMLGGYLISYFFKWKYTRKRSNWLALFIAALSVAFIWVGSYGYNYSIAFFNSPYINWWALTAWSVSGMIMIYIFNVIKNKLNYFWGIALTWLIYIIVLFTVEYIAYHIISLRETSEGATPLIFDIVHGNRIMHIYYTTAPLYFMGLFIFMKYLFKKSTEND